MMTIIDLLSKIKVGVLFVCCSIVCAHGSAAVSPETTTELPQVILDRVDMKRVEQRSAYFHDLIVRADRNRTYFYTSAGIVGIAALCAGVLYYFGAGEKKPSSKEDLNKLETVLMTEKLKYFTGKNSTIKTIGVIIASGVGATLAGVISQGVLDVLAAITGISKRTIKQFFGQASSSCFFDVCQKLEKNVQLITRSFASFIKNLGLLQTYRDDEEESYKEFLYAELLLDYRVLLSSIEDILAFAHQGLQKAGQQRVVFENIIVALQQLVDEMGSYFEQMVNNLTQTSLKNNMPFKALTFSKKLSTVLFINVMALGKALYGQDFELA
ncbi:MAG: hypothetical protein V1855_02875 [bacterium]